MCVCVCVCVQLQYFACVCACVSAYVRACARSRNFVVIVSVLCFVMVYVLQFVETTPERVHYYCCIYFIVWTASADCRKQSVTYTASIAFRHLPPLVERCRILRELVSTYLAADFCAQFRSVPVAPICFSKCTDLRAN